MKPTFWCSHGVVKLAHALFGLLSSMLRGRCSRVIRQRLGEDCIQRPRIAYEYALMRKPAKTHGYARDSKNAINISVSSATSATCA